MAFDYSGQQRTDELLKVENLTISFGAKKVLENLSFDIRPGEIVGLLGESGSGKSTAAYGLLGLVKEPGAITSGRVLYKGADILTMPEPQVRKIRGREIGLIVQNPRSALHPMIKVGDQIETAWLSHNYANSQKARARALEMLELVGINDPARRLEAFAHELSGGMAQRVLIAMALSSSPLLLIADEPTSGLDVTIQAQFLDQLWHTVRATGSSVLLVTQEDGIIANYCDRVLVLKDGRISDQDETKAFFRRNRAASLVDHDIAPAPPASEAAPLVEVRDLRKIFPLPNKKTAVQAVSDFNLVIRPGETVGLVGESGSGKSTAGRTMMRLIEATAGQILFKGKNMSAMSRDELKRVRAKMQIILQDPYDSVDPRWTVEQILSEPLVVHGVKDPAAREKRILELLELVELDPEMLSMRPRDLGAGALQRVSIARSLATEPEFIILDEPTSVLAPSARVRLIALLRKLQNELNLSFLFISHDLTTVSQVCDRVVVMYLSQMVEVGPTEQIFHAPLHPYTRALIASHLSPDPENRRIDREVLDQLSGEIPSPINLPQGCYLASRCPYRRPDCKETAQVLHDFGDGRQIRCAHAERIRAERADQPAFSA